MPSVIVRCMDQRACLKSKTGRLAQLVERRTREHNVSGLYRWGFESPAGQTKITNYLSDETLNRGPV